MSIEINSLVTQGLTLVLTASLPAVLAAGLSGLFIAILQALTQIQDQGLPTAVKFFAVILALFLTYLSTANDFMSYGTLIFDVIAKV